MRTLRLCPRRMCRDALRTDGSARVPMHIGSTHVVHVGELDLQGREQRSGWGLHSHGDDLRVEDGSVPGDIKASKAVRGVEWH